MSVPGASAARVEVDGTVLDSEHAWVEDGTSCITLRAFAWLSPYELVWDSESATASLAREGMELRAKPGDLYITANGRALAVKGGVRVIDGKMILPLRVLAEATGAELVWNDAGRTAQLTFQEAVELPAASAYDEEALYWLSRIISAESRGESLEGQIAVGNVVLNRVESDQYPDTVKEVVFDQRNGVQFEPVANGTVYDEPAESAVLAARLCLGGADMVGDALYFYAPALSAGTWIVKNCTYIKTIGCHRFYK